MLTLPGFLLFFPSLELQLLASACVLKVIHKSWKSLSDRIPEGTVVEFLQGNQAQTQSLDLKGRSRVEVYPLNIWFTTFFQLNK